MPTQLKYVDPGRPRSLFSRAYAALSPTASSRHTRRTGATPQKVNRTIPIVQLTPP